MGTVVVQVVVFVIFATTGRAGAVFRRSPTLTGIFGKMFFAKVSPSYRYAQIRIRISRGV